MAKEPKGSRPRGGLRLVQGGKGAVRRAYEACRGSVVTAVDNVTTVLSPDDEAYASEIAQRLRRA